MSLSFYLTVANKGENFETEKEIETSCENCSRFLLLCDVWFIESSENYDVQISPI